MNCRDPLYRGGADPQSIPRRGFFRAGLLGLGVIALGPLLAPPSGAADPLTPRADDPQAIIARAVQALGGEARLRQVGAEQVRFKGIFRDLDNAPFTGEVFLQFPDRYKLILEADVGGMKLHMAEALAGDKVWMRVNDQDEPLDTARRDDMKRTFYVQDLTRLLPLLGNKTYTLAPLEDILVEGRPAVGVQVGARDRPEVKLYFDRKTGLLVKTAYRTIDPTAKKEVLRESILSDYREVDPAAADERVVRAAGVTVDGPALVDFLRKQTPAETELDKIRGLIRRLGDDAFAVRARAHDDLVALGTRAVPLLKQAAQDADAEVAGGARKCLEMIGKSPDATVPVAVVRLLALRRPARALEALLAYLPWAPDAAAVQEVQQALVGVAFPDGQPDPVLVKAREARDPLRRATAAALLDRAGKGGTERPSSRLPLRGLQYPWKAAEFQDGKKMVEQEVVDVQFFNRLPESVFAKP